MVGPRFNFQQVPQGMAGGFQYYPLVGVVNGLQVTAASAVFATGGQSGDPLTDLLVTISPGACRLEGKLHQLASAITNMRFSGVATNMSVAGTYIYNLYINPRRVVPVLSSPPGSPSNGDVYINATQIDNYMATNGIFQWNGSAWVAYNAIQAPPSYGFNNMPLNDIRAVIDTSTSNNASFAINKPELNVYHKVNIPVALSKPGEANLRKSAALQLATITVNGGSSPTVSIATYPESLLIAM